MKVFPIRTRVFRENEDLVAFICQHIPKLRNGAVLAVTSKIVALSEGRTAEAKNKKEKDALIRAESKWMLPSKLVWLTLKDGMLLPNAGLDESNAGPSTSRGIHKIVLLPEDSYSSASSLRAQLKKHYKIKNLGVVITDSRVMPLRRGVEGVALGYAGFKGIHDYRGKTDIFGRKLKITWQNIPDALAAAAALCMGEGNEQQPLAVIKDAPIVFTEKVTRNELLVSPREDMYTDVLRRPKRR